MKSLLEHKVIEILDRIFSWYILVAPQIREDDQRTG